VCENSTKRVSVSSHVSVEASTNNGSPLFANADPGTSSHVSRRFWGLYVYGSPSIETQSIGRRRFCPSSNGDAGSTA
jgi:hypothetical protein